MATTVPVDIGQFIYSRPDFRDGRPCIAGTGMSVRAVASRYLRGETADEIANDHDDIPRSHIYAALAYYFADREAMDAELDAEQAEHPPFGDYTCSPRETWMGVFTTSGTTGRKLMRVVSHRDWKLMLGRFRRMPLPPPGEVFMLLGPVDGLLGPTVGIEAWRMLGSIPVLAGLWDTRTKVRMIQELRPAVVAGAASYLIHLSEVAAEMGVDLSDCGLRGVTSFGEPGAAVEATHATIERRYGVEQIVDGYGLTEVWPMGGNCALSRTLHIAEDIVAVECVDPDTGEPLPEGETSEPEGYEDEEPEAGVEIEVTPPGKSTKRLSLLSGGEKSLVALAFMFAVFLARPCPFYLLDEVEAALDDINIDRFLQLVRRYSDRAQFIVVTHQKRTMDAADTLYGVSMGGDGISRVISRRLEGAGAGDVAA